MSRQHVITPATKPATGPGRRVARRVTIVTAVAGLASGLAAAPAALASTAEPAGTATTAAPASSLNTGGKLLVGVRSKNFGQAQSLLGPIAVTRKYYDKLPSKYRQPYPGNVTTVISYVNSSTANTASYVKSVPAGAKIVLVFHHEPEGNHSNDYPGAPATAGAKFVSEFNAQAQVIHANSKVPVGFIAGGYQYRNGGRGAGGAFIPPSADEYFMDSYAQNNALVPSSQNQTVTNYIALLKKRGKSFAGFSEYARGTASASSAARIKVLQADNTWLRSIGAKIWVYWWAPSPQTGDNWQFKDSATIAAWRKIASQ